MSPYDFRDLKDDIDEIFRDRETDWKHTIRNRLLYRLDEMVTTEELQYVLHTILRLDQYRD